MTQGKCCGVQAAPAVAGEKRENRTPGQLKWIGQKLAVVLTSGIMAYTAYVYIGRLCVPMIRRSSDAGAGRGAGSECRYFCLFFEADVGRSLGIVALLIVFAVLYLWMIWAYIKVSPLLAVTIKISVLIIITIRQ